MKLQLTKEEAERVINDDHEEFVVIDSSIVDATRWSIIYRVVIQRKSDGKYFADTYGVGATECQDERPWEYSEPDFEEVQKIEKTVWVYEPV